MERCSSRHVKMRWKVSRWAEPLVVYPKALIVASTAYFESLLLVKTQVRYPPFLMRLCC